MYKHLLTPEEKEIISQAIICLKSNDYETRILGEGLLNANFNVRDMNIYIGTDCYFNVFLLLPLYPYFKVDTICLSVLNTILDQGCYECKGT